MLKNNNVYIIISIVLFSLVAMGSQAEELFLSSKNKELHWRLQTSPHLKTVTLPKETQTKFSSKRPPYVGNSFIGFKEALGFRESRSNYFITSNLGYLGKYQFGKSILRFFGITDTEAFLNSPEQQERLFKITMSYYKWIFRSEIEQFSGQCVGGILVSESGILAAAHLAGISNVKRFFKSQGKFRFRDANGTSIRNYMTDFHGFDVSDIPVEKP